MIRPGSASTAASLQPRSTAAEVTRSVVLLLVGLAWPAIVHLTPSQIPLGPILMPLLLPAALAAFLLPTRSALAVCAIMPFLSMATTGMPPAPIACGLVAEGAALVAVVKALERVHAPWWLAYTGGALASRCVTLMLALLMAGSMAEVGLGLVGLALSGLLLPVLFAFLGVRRSPGE